MEWPRSRGGSSGVRGDRYAEELVLLDESVPWDESDEDG